MIPSSNINDTDSSSIIQTHDSHHLWLNSFISTKKKLWRALTFSSGTQMFLSMTNWNESVFEGIDSQNDPCYAARDVVLKGSDPQTMGWTGSSSKYCVGCSIYCFISGSNASCKCFSASSFSSLDRLECSSVKWISPHMFLYSVYTLPEHWRSQRQHEKTTQDVEACTSCPPVPRPTSPSLTANYESWHCLEFGSCIYQYLNLNISENVKIYLNVSMSLCLYFHVYKHHDYGMPKIVISKTFGFMWMSQTWQWIKSWGMWTRTQLEGHQKSVKYRLWLARQKEIK